MIFAWFQGWRVATAAVLISALLTPFASTAEARPKEVLVLHSFGREFRPWSEYAKAIRLELERQSPWLLDIQEHALVTARSSDDNPEIEFADYLRVLFMKRPPDLIVSIGGPAANFVQRHRNRLFPSTPMILAVVDQRQIQHSILGPNDTVAAVVIDYHAAIENILQVLPDTDHVAVVIGKSPIERFWRDEIARESSSLEGRVKFTWYDALSFEDILVHATNLPPHSAIFWALMVVDAAGVVHAEGKALARLHAVANAPIFSFTDAFFGQEIVGGPHVPMLDVGGRVAAAAIRILNGESAGSIKVPPVGMGEPKFDWREMQRWGIDEARLPPGSEIHFRSPTPWERYRVYILAVCAAILLQVLVIIWLLYEQRRRQAAEMLVRGTMAELHNVNKLAAAGELSAFIAHEVKQPLTVVAANAYAALNWLATGRRDLDEARKSLNKIVDATHRANDIISGVRAMLVSDERDETLIDLNEMILSVLTISQPNLRSHDIELETQLDEDLPPIFANRVQIQQVILNLVMNAVESMQSSATRKLRVCSERTAAAGVRVAIEDTGAGIDPADLDRIFKPLFTTKKRGMGMGLVICRLIVEAHGGRISVASAPQGRTVFAFELPAKSACAAA